MSRTIGLFGYAITEMTESDRRPFEPIVRIFLKRWATTKEDVPTLSPELMTDEEIDHNIQLLKDDLDNVGRRAKAALKTAQTSTQKIVASRISNR